MQGRQMRDMYSRTMPREIGKDEHRWQESTLAVTVLDSDLEPPPPRTGRNASSALERRMTYLVCRFACFSGVYFVTLVVKDLSRRQTQSGRRVDYACRNGNQCKIYAAFRRV